MAIVTIRPRDLALLLLASGELSPRQRARDQAPDIAGLAMKHRILERIAAIDPEPADLEATLLTIVDEMGQPTGPTRAIALSIREEWEMACLSPDLTAHLLSEATQHSAEEKRRGH